MNWDLYQLIVVVQGIDLDLHQLIVVVQETNCNLGHEEIKPE